MEDVFPQSEEIFLMLMGTKEKLDDHHVQKYLGFPCGHGVPDGFQAGKLLKTWEEMVICNSFFLQ